MICCAHASTAEFSLPVEISLREVRSRAGLDSKSHLS